MGNSLMQARRLLICAARAIRISVPPCMENHDFLVYHHVDGRHCLNYILLDYCQI